MESVKAGLDTGWVRRRLSDLSACGVANLLAHLRSILSPTHVCLTAFPLTPLH
jgi:hypothetical protein